MQNLKDIGSLLSEYSITCEDYKHVAKIKAWIHKLCKADLEHREKRNLLFELLMEQLELKQIDTPFCYEPIEIKEVIIKVNDVADAAEKDTCEEDVTKG